MCVILPGGSASNLKRSCPWVAVYDEARQLPACVPTQRGRASSWSENECILVIDAYAFCYAEWNKPGATKANTRKQPDKWEVYYLPLPPVPVHGLLGARSPTAD